MGGIVEEASRKKHLGGSITEEGGIMEEASWVHLGNIWDASGKHLGGMWSYGRLLEGSGMHMGCAWGLSGDLGCLGGLWS